jgi:hypothetical protein
MISDMTGRTVKYVPRVVPDTMFVVADGNTIPKDPVTTIKVHPPGTMPHIREDLYVVEVFTVHGSRLFGTPEAKIGPDLRVHVLVNEGDEVKAGWEVSEYL